MSKAKTKTKVIQLKNKQSESEQLYSELVVAFNYYNTELFGDSLPDTIITLNRVNKSYGYFVNEIWTNSEEEKISEIALNPSEFKNRTIEETLSTLVHEMCHLWQYVHGTPSRSGYHNKEFAEMMESIGLQVSSTGMVGGKTTGQKMTHYILGGGEFIKVTELLLATGWVFSFNETWEKTKKKAVANSKVKYTCTTCEQNAWAKPDSKLVCGDCEETMLSD